MAVDVYQDVLGFQISIKYALRMQVFDRQKHLSKVKQGMFFRHRSFSGKMEEDFASRAKV